MVVVNDSDIIQPTCFFEFLEDIQDFVKKKLQQIKYIYCPYLRENEERSPISREKSIKFNHLPKVLLVNLIIV